MPAPIEPDCPVDVILTEIRRWDEAGERQLCTDLIFDTIDSLLCDGRLGDVDAILAAADVDHLSSSALRSLAVITEGAKDRLPSRREYLDRATAVIAGQCGRAKAERLMGRMH